jgi:hypothetical protein
LVERVGVVILPFDITNPPEEPPDGADRLMWILAFGLHREHQPDADGLCLAGSCRGANPEPWPCPASKLAQGGFVFATWQLRKPFDQEPVPCRRAAP